MALDNDTGDIGVQLICEFDSLMLEKSTHSQRMSGNIFRHHVIHIDERHALDTRLHKAYCERRAERPTAQNEKPLRSAPFDPLEALIAYKRPVRIDPRHLKRHNIRQVELGHEWTCELIRKRRVCGGQDNKSRRSAPGTRRAPSLQIEFAVRRLVCQSS
ncbi:hypothetical protein WI97_14320 [Burkholderia vietnamiensis]|nr:hypothetical protein WI97_14320 [Burkholderia vietnamiensis]